MTVLKLDPDRRRILLAGAALMVAVGVGFTAAKLTNPRSAAPEHESEERSAPASSFAMDVNRLVASGVEVQPVAVGGLASEIVAQATVTAEPTGEATLTARAAGSVARISKRLGDPVRAGEVLALVESREAAQIAADRRAGAAKADLARKVLAREQRLYEQKVSPRQDLETAQAELASAEAEARRAQVAAGAADVTSDGRYLAVISPISGRVTAMTASLGAYVQPETELFRVADPSKVQVEASVTGADAQRTAPGDTALLELSNGEIRTALVRSVTPSLNQETRAATVVLAPSSNAGLQPGQPLRVRITSRRTASSGIVIPEEAVQTLNGHDVVFVRTPKGFRVQTVTIGQRSSGRLEIRAGLTGGQSIAVKNAFLLKAELGKGSEEEE